MRIILSTMAVVVALTACQPTATSKVTDKTTPTAQATSQATSQAANSPPAKHHLVKSDMHLTTKVKSKQCFGSAGCNVEVEVNVEWANGDPGKLDGQYDVTYKITGDDSGPYIDTLTVYPNGKYDVPMFPAYLSTRSTNTPIGVTVTSVSR